VIYFAQLGTGSIKIGTTEDLDGRMDTLESHYGEPVTLLGTMPGGRKEEREIHERFTHLRFGRTEQFRPSAELLEFIGKPLLVSPNPDAVEMAAGRARRLAKPVRLDLSEKDHERLDRVATAKGLNMAAYSRMAILERLRKDEEEVDR
jgi:hypothetical protein